MVEGQKNQVGGVVELVEFVFVVVLAYMRETIMKWTWMISYRRSWAGFV